MSPDASRYAHNERLNVYSPPVRTRLRRRRRARRAPKRLTGQRQRKHIGANAGARRTTNAAAASSAVAGATPRPLLASVPLARRFPMDAEARAGLHLEVRRHATDQVRHAHRFLTEDCFDGMVKTAADLPSKVDSGHDNPQTGPFFIEERSRATRLPFTFSSSSPRAYGVVVRARLRALVGTDQTMILGPNFPETWRYDIDARGTRPALPRTTASWKSWCRSSSGRCSGCERGADVDRAGAIRRQHGLPGSAWGTPSSSA